MVTYKHRTPTARGFPDNSLAQTQHPPVPRLSLTLTLAHKTQTLLCTVPADAYKASFSHSCSGAHRHRTHFTQIQNQTKPLPSCTQPYRSHGRKSAERLQTYRYSLFLSDPPAQIRPTSLPSPHPLRRTILGPPAANCFPTFAGRPRSPSLREGGVRSRRCRQGGWGSHVEAGGTISICMGSALEEQLPEAEPQRAQSCGQAAAAQLIELGWPGPATRATRVRFATRPSRRRRLLGAKGRIEGGRHPRLSPCPRQPLPLEIIPLSRGLRGALGAGIPNWTATL